jgi:hypothetical protein
VNRPNAAVEIGEACVPNIGRRGQIRRLRNGVIELVLGIGAAVAFIMSGGVPWWLWLPVAGLYFLGLLGVFQAKEKT